MADEARVREEICRIGESLYRRGYTVGTAGNISARLDDGFMITPTDACLGFLEASRLAKLDANGEQVSGDRASKTILLHRAIYDARPDAGGIVHTHSDYATAWAARGEEIPCVITAMADEFGGPIPVGPFAVAGDDSIGRGIVDTLTEHRSPAVLMAGHGPFTIGATARDAVKAAVMLEDVARTVHIASQRGPVAPLPQETIDRLYDRYQHVYGQHGGTRRTPRSAA